jgi:hypothetical protein
MDKDILTHAEFVREKIAKLEKAPDKAAAATLLSYHDMMTRNFQHERAIHLAVTLFFAVLTLGAWAAFVAWFVLSATFSDSGDSANIVTLALFLLGLILSVLEFFYIRHYYRLENRTQKLYPLAEQIFRLTSR